MSQISLVPSSEARSKLAPLSFACDYKADGLGSIRVHVEGELDLTRAPEFRRVLRRALSEARLVSLDLQGLSFIDCCALNEILRADALARRTGARLILVRGSGQVDRMLALTGVLEWMEILDLGPADRLDSPTTTNGGLLDG